MLCTSGFVDEVIFPQWALHWQVGCELKITVEGASPDRGRSLMSIIAVFIY